MRGAVFLVLSAGLCACAGSPSIRNPDAVLADQLFERPARLPSGTGVFALSPEMKAYLDGPIENRVRLHGGQLGLYKALRDELKLEYDSAVTRNAAETFEARSGNCLSLVILTAAFAKQLGIPIHYQAVYGHDVWSRSNGIAFLSGHVNLVLGARRIANLIGGKSEPDSVTIDFLPAEEIRAGHSHEIPEQTVVAMYLNNRAAETLAQGDVDDAYWWAREAIHASPSFASPYNTLGVIYRRHGHPREAELVLRQALERERDNTQALSNLAAVLADQGRAGESRSLLERLARIQAYPPFYFLDQGMTAMTRGNLKLARTLFKRELARSPYDHEVHFALAVANFRLGDLRQARKHLTLAWENGTTRDRRELYAAKLDRLKALQARGEVLHPAISQ
jgi:Tfp pilus assembly protein PilF